MSALSLADQEVCQQPPCRVLAAVECLPPGRSACVADGQGNIGSGNTGLGNFGNDNSGSYNIGSGNHGDAAWGDALMGSGLRCQVTMGRDLACSFSGRGPSPTLDLGRSLAAVRPPTSLLPAARRLLPAARKGAGVHDAAAALPAASATPPAAQLGDPTLVMNWAFCGKMGAYEIQCTVSITAPAAHPTLYVHLELGWVSAVYSCTAVGPGYEGTLEVSGGSGTVGYAYATYITADRQRLVSNSVQLEPYPSPPPPSAPSPPAVSPPPSPFPPAPPPPPPTPPPSFPPPPPTITMSSARCTLNSMSGEVACVTTVTTAELQPAIHVSYHIANLEAKDAYQPDGLVSNHVWRTLDANVAGGKVSAYYLDATGAQVRTPWVRVGSAR
ncbi:hypothetical protein APUTEX25_001841 [Auxenochlorella protothecoides]|uniref:Uncharacterized protein n=1 Tax=Auxenochlorella protothecoides TaxID=3075 RepID=A0A3M7L4H1_AUXPR|nr:hypothetical protein APUTEX25_001841 [Auxenochlorella protothecoides]|eukprot:RMZ57641.1 hypothetical protein APUTEX25_001841 [Auxenochlorella protothecoides]